MLTNKITISDDLLDTVRGILGEAKKCPADCECEKCEAEEMEEGYASAAQRKAVWANRADDGAGHPDKKKKLKEEILEMVNEASSGLADKAKKSGVSLSTLKKVYARGIAAWNSGHRPGTTPQQWAHARVNSYITKGKGTYHGADKDLRSEGADMPFEGPYKKAGEERKDQYGNKVKNVAKYLAKKAMKANEEAEHNNCGTPECCGQCDTAGQIDETAKIVAHLQKRYGDNIRKSHVRSAANDFGVDASKLAKAVRTKLGKNMLDEEDDGWYTHSQMHGSKKSEKHPKGISAAEWKSGIRWHHGKNKRINIKEEAEQIDELSNTYSAPAKVPQKMIKPEAARRMANTANRKNMSDKDVETVLFNQGHGRKSLKLINQLRKEEAEQIDELSKKPGGILDTYQQRGTFKGDKNRDVGRKLATKKLNPGKYGMEAPKVAATNEEAEQIDELSKATMGRYINKAADRMSTQGVTAGLKIAADEKSKKNFDTIAKRQKGIATAVSKLTKEEQDFVDSLNDETFEEVEITEARGRPRKAGAKDFTIHPKTKEKLMHNNPAHMKTIEVLQKNGILEKPKVEAGQHIMNQLSKAKTSMLGGSKIHFTHGDSKEVSGTHAAKILTKYAGMKPNEKEDFQKFVGHSHENLMKHV